MKDTGDATVLRRMLRAAADKVAAGEQALSALDAATGDGDHGAAMRKVAQAIVATLDAQADADMQPMLEAVAWAVMGTDAGSTGPLYGSLLAGMSESAGVPLDSGRFATMLETGSAMLQANSRARPGDKTLIDALVPAVQATRTAADAGQSLKAALARAADAADRGARATTDMRAVFGRAKNIGDRSIGHADPGATSLALFFAGLHEGLNHA